MTIRTKVNSTWTDADRVYAKVSGNWERCSVYTKVSGSWNKVHDKTEIFTYPVLSTSVLTGWACYTFNGNKLTNSGDTLWSSDPVHGTYDYDNYQYNRYSLLLFDYAQIQSDLAGKTISSCTLRAKRQNTSHGISGSAIPRFNAHDQSTLPSTFLFSQYGDFLIDTGASYSNLGRGQEFTYTLFNSFAENLRDGTEKGIILGIVSPTNEDVDYYIKYDITRFLLTITVG